jgi:type I restriction enzyme, S subunit
VPVEMTGWQTAALSDVLADANSGFACGEDPTDGVFQFRMNNITTEGQLDFSKKRRVPRDTRSLESFFVEPGDILFNATNSPELVGKSAFFPGHDEPAVFSNHFLRLRPREDKLDGRYLARWLVLQFQRRVFQGMCRQWVNQATVGRDSLLGLQMPLPPLAEQRRIAEVLDCAEALRAKRRAAFAKLDTLTQSIFLDMFGDPATNPKGFPIRQLTDLVREDDTINYGVVQPGDDLDEGVPLVRVGDLLGGRISHAALKRIAPTIESAYKRSRLRGDEILVSCVGSIGVVALADETARGFNIARAVARVPLGEGASRLFMAAYLKTDFVQRYFINELRTVSQPTLNIKQLSETAVVLPPFSMQREFACLVDAVEKLKAIHSASLAELDALFASLQNRAFRGEL